MVGLVLADVDFVLTFDTKEIALTCLQARKLLHRDQWLAHQWDKKALLVEFSANSVVSSASAES